MTGRRASRVALCAIFTAAVMMAAPVNMGCASLAAQTPAQRALAALWDFEHLQAVGADFAESVVANPARTPEDVEAVRVLSRVDYEAQAAIRTALGALVASCPVTPGGDPTADLRDAIDAGCLTKAGVTFVVGTFRRLNRELRLVLRQRGVLS